MCQTCKGLRAVTEERHLWLTQFKWCCTAFRQALFLSRTKNLHTRSTAQLKSWTIQQARTSALWQQNEGTSNCLKLQRVRIGELEDIEYKTTFLLPGGEYLAGVTTIGDIVLKKIERGNGIRGPGWVLADVARCPSPSPGARCIGKVFTDTICEYPLIACHDRQGTRYVASFMGCSPGVRHSQGYQPLASLSSSWITTLERFLCKRRFELTLTIRRAISTFEATPSCGSTLTSMAKPRST